MKRYKKKGRGRERGGGGGGGGENLCVEFPLLNTLLSLFLKTAENNNFYVDHLYIDHYTYSWLSWAGFSEDINIAFNPHMATHV